MTPGKTCSRGHAYSEEPCPVCWPGYRTYTVRSEVWLYEGGEAAWHFVTVPKVVSEKIRERFGAIARGWGSLRVKVTIGKTCWKTSIFPDKKTSAYVLPIKADVRKKEDIAAGDTADVTLEILD